MALQTCEIHLDVKIAIFSKNRTTQRLRSQPQGPMASGRWRLLPQISVCEKQTNLVLRSPPRQNPGYAPTGSELSPQKIFEYCLPKIKN